MSPDVKVASDSSGNSFELRRIACPICGPCPSRPIGYRGGARHRYGLGLTSLIVRCTRCGLLFPDPFPFPVDPQRLYGDPEKYFATHDADAKVASYQHIISELIVDSGIERPSLLDIGSGRGEALHAAQSLGLTDIVGLELSEAMREETQRRYG